MEGWQGGRFTHVLPEKRALLDGPNQHQHDSRYHYGPQVARPRARNEARTAMPVSDVVDGASHDLASGAVSVVCGSPAVMSPSSAQ